MSTNFPTSLDTLTNPTSTDSVATVDHAAQHANANDAIEALQAKVGADSSVVTSSHDYKLSEVTGSDKAVGKTATQTLTNKTLTSPTISNPTFSGTTQFIDADFSIKDNSDGTKVAKFEVSGITTATTRTKTLQDVSGTIYETGGTDVAIADGGTGASTATAGFDNLAPTTTKGDLITRNSSNNIRIGVGSDGQVLTADSAQTAGIKWATPTTRGAIKTGSTTKDASSTTATTIAHGLGVAPRLVKLTAVFADTNTSDTGCITIATYDGTTQSSGYMYTQTSSGTEEGASNAFRLTGRSSHYNDGTITIDATNITISWSKTGSPTGTAYIIWEAYE